MKKKNVFWGVMIILFAFYYLLNELEVIPEFFAPHKLIITVFLVVIAIRCFVGHFLTGMMVSIGLILCMYGSKIGLSKIIPLPLLFTCFLIGVGLDVMFKGTWRKKENFHGEPPKFANNMSMNYDSEIKILNSFNSISKYVDSQNFYYGNISNNFGQCNIYFNNASLGNGKAKIDVKNSFGETNLYFPNNWRVDVRQNISFGEIKYKGIGNTNAEAPVVFVDAHSSFGNVVIHFD